MALIKRCRRAKNLRAKDFKARFGRRSQIIPSGARRAQGGNRQTSKFHMAPRLCYVLSFDPRTYSLTHRPVRVHSMHAKFLLDLLAPRVRLESLSKAAISPGASLKHRSQVSDRVFLKLETIEESKC